MFLEFVFQWQPEDKSTFHYILLCTYWLVGTTEIAHTIETCVVSYINAIKTQNEVKVYAHTSRPTPWYTGTSGFITTVNSYPNHTTYILNQSNPLYVLHLSFM